MEQGLGSDHGSDWAVEPLAVAVVALITVVVVVVLVAIQTV